MSNVTYQQVLAILLGWSGNPSAKAATWGSTYNFVVFPPPPLPFGSDGELALYIAEHYTGPKLT